MKKLLVICGVTATGKTDLAIKLAKILDGELINADSRQVYRGMDIGTGKDLPVSSKFIVRSSKFRFNNLKLNPSFASPLSKGRIGGVNKKLTIGYRLKNDIPIWLVDVCEPDYVFNVGEYQKIAKLVINDIWNRGKLPIVVGGTGLFIKSILEPLDNIHIPPNNQLRRQLNNLSVKQLQDKLIQLYKSKWENMNHSDQNNPRRLIRAIEIEDYLSSQVKAKGIDMQRRRNCASPDFLTNAELVRNDRHELQMGSPLPIGESLVIGLTGRLDYIKQKIEKRVDKRVKQGVVTEIQNLLNLGYSWMLPSMSAIGYGEWKNYLNSLQFAACRLQPEEQAMNLWKLHEIQYAKRQMTYFKKIKGVNWFDISVENRQKKLFNLIRQWYNKTNN